MARIIICGDYAPTQSNEDVLSERNVTIASIVGKELADIFLDADFSVVNVETSLTTSNTPKMKRGQINTSKPSCVEFLRKINARVALLANNHVIDNGANGITDTIRCLEDSGINTIGIGKSIECARQPYVHIDNGKVIKILNIANNEFNDLTEGFVVNTLDFLESFDWIREEKKDCDCLIVVYHGGVEFYQYATPMLQKICRKMVDCGADIVTCQHSHCIGTVEKYGDSTIVYGQGNFLFDDTDHELEKTAILLGIDTDSKSVRIIPVLKEGVLVRAANSQETSIIIDTIRERSKLSEEQLQQKFSEWCNLQEREVFNACAGYFKPYKVVNKLFGRTLEKMVYDSKSRMRLYNMLKSVALLEVFEEVMSRYE